jgi:hypothetical protein
MNIIQIKQLLEKFYNGETTLDEEKAMEAYFLEEHPADKELLDLKKQFMLYHQMRGYQPDIASLKQKIASGIDELEEKAIPRERTLHMTRWLAAASILLLVGFAGILAYHMQKDKSKDTFSNPQMAYQEAEKTLLFVSQQMNKGMQPLNHISKINTAAQNLKVLNKMDESMGMLKLVSIVNKSSNLKK